MKTPSALHAVNATTFERSYAGTKDQIRKVREALAPLVKGYPFAGDFVLLASEVSTNAVLHSRSSLPGGMFTVRAEIHPGDYARLEVEDQGGEWDAPDTDDEHGRGLGILAFLAGDGNWGVKSGDTPDTCVVWARLDWAAHS